MADQRAKLSWRDETVPVSDRFDDPYFSLQNGLEETRHVFLQGNDLPARFAPGFHIAELGFGTGLNMLTAWSEWEKVRAIRSADVHQFRSLSDGPCRYETRARGLSRAGALGRPVP